MCSHNLTQFLACFDAEFLTKAPKKKKKENHDIMQHSAKHNGADNEKNILQLDKLIYLIMNEGTNLT